MSAPTGPGGPTATTPGQAAANGTQGPNQMSNQNLNQIVTDFLLKRGYNRTERIFREESRNINEDGRPIADENAPFAPQRFQKAFDLLKNWVENNLSVYKFELEKLLWPYFVYSWIELIDQGEKDIPAAYLKHVWDVFERNHGDDLRVFATIHTSEHLKENQTTALYRSRKYKIPINMHITGDLFHFLEREDTNGGNIIRDILARFCDVEALQRGPISPFSFEAIYRRSQGRELDDVDMQEGIPGHTTGVMSNREILATPLKLGPLPMEEGLREDVRAELAEEDERNPPKGGRAPLAVEFDQKIKMEEVDDMPSRADLPLPPSRVRDVVMEMQKVKENRDRFKIEGRTGGVGPQISCCMFTLHNTLGAVSSMDFSRDNRLIAAGTMDSYIRVWTLDGSPLMSKNPAEKDVKINNRKLIGHSAPVYGISFSDAIETDPNRPLFGETDKQLPDTGPKFLLSSSGDGTVRLWSLEAWSCLVVYKGHHGPVMKVQFSPHGHYFLTGGWDKTGRIWMQDHISAVRILVGHDTSISSIAWHPNGTYVFTASDETDKSIRMWNVPTGDCVRVFVGHTDYISSMECAPNGRILASADNSGNIFFWDLEKGVKIKRSRGHGKGGIWSMSFSVESTVLASAGQDCTVRIWDVAMPADGHKVAQQQAGAQPGQEQGETSAAAGAPGTAAGSSTSTQPQTGSTNTNPGQGKKKGKEVMITPDQVSCWSTKKTPVRKVIFTRMNLVVAGGCYEPDR